MTQILSYFPGQIATVFLEIKDGYGTRLDAFTAPMVTRIIFPAFTLSVGYPQIMVQLDTGLYYHQFTLPSGAVSIGSYLVEVEYKNPFNHINSFETYQIIVNAPFGNFGAVVSV